MKDLFRSTVSRDDFQRWLDLGTSPFAIRQGEKVLTILSRLEKMSSVDYLYSVPAAKDNSISWDSNLQFCGVYDMRRKNLYLTQDSLRILTSGEFPLVAEVGPSMAGEINSGIDERVESMIANDRDNLPAREVSSCRALRSLQYYQEHGARADAIQYFFEGREPDGQFHSGYALNGLPEAAFIAYITDPAGFIQTEAEQHIKSHQEGFLLQFLENDALRTEYHALIQDTGNPIHRMKAITDAIKGSGAKTVTVTVRKDGQELTFKADADSLMGHRSYYSTYDIPAPDRREFERVFGRHADYNAEDITKITYGRNTIYEAPAEEMESVMQMGGM